MEKATTLNQMARYDFAAPINVTMIFDDDSDDEMISEISLKEKIQIKENNKVTENEYESKEKHLKKDLETIDLVNDKIVPEDSLIAVEIPPADKSSIGEADLANNRNHAVTDMIAYGNAEITQEQKDKEELTSYVRNLLNTLSEHIIIIMQGYYNHFYNIQPQPPDINSWIKLTQLKKHFFDLSYSSVVTLIIPQENNNKFIKQFIDKTLHEANKRMKCERQHVERVYNEMVAWTKRKRERINKFKEQNINEAENNKILIEHLNRPTSLMPQDHNKGPPNRQNGACIFSYGAPGNEISITVDPDTLIRHNSIPCQRNSPNSMSCQRNSPNSIPCQRNSPNSMQHQRSSPNSVQHQLSSPNRRPTTNEMRSYRHNNTHLPNSQPPHIDPYNRQIPHLPPNCYQSSTIHHYPTQPLPPPRQPPPPYASNFRPPAPGIYPYNIGQIQANINHAMQNHAVYRHAFASQPMNHQIEMYRTLTTEGQTAEGPIITNVTSLNQTHLHKNGRCCVCGKITDTSFTNPYYCSSLCQELDSRIQGTYEKSN